MQHAQAHELDSATESYQIAAGMHADIATLQAAHELGMPYTDAVMAGAVHYN
jgi:hypothetical protein